VGSGEFTGAGGPGGGFNLEPDGHC
jgi:hypothetical protein